MRYSYSSVKRWKIAVGTKYGEDNITYQTERSPFGNSYAILKSTNEKVGIYSFSKNTGIIM